jgi:hypothetical protein
VLSFHFLLGFDLEKQAIFSIWHVVFWHPWDLEMSARHAKQYG